MKTAIRWLVYIACAPTVAILLALYGLLMVVAWAFREEA